MGLNRSGIIGATLCASLILLTGCSNATTTNNSINTVLNGAVPSSISNDSIQGNTIKTYSVTSNEIPQELVANLNSVCKIPVYLPKFFPQLEPPQPTGYSVAISSEVAPTAYHLGIFWRVDGSKSNAFDDSEYIGNIDTSTTAPNITPFISNLKFKSSIRLNDGRLVQEYSLLKNEPQQYIAGAVAIEWNEKHWTYLSSGFPYTKDMKNQTTVGMANIISGFLSAHQSVITNVKQGYVIAQASGNRPSVQVSWTYNSKQWYTITTTNVEQALRVANSVRHVRP